MRTWLYYRLSNDDDKEMNSLQNQRKICMDYAAQYHLSVVGESFDDNASGMNFRRAGINELAQAAEQRKFDAVIVKDFSRLGRHRTQTDLFLDFLREQGVRVISATENLNSFEEKDDLTIGVRGLMNDYYARDIGKKIRDGYRQKQKEGIVIIPPFGYWKNKNTGQVEVIEEAADTICVMYVLLLGGNGLKEIARHLNARGCKTPAQFQKELYGKEKPDVKRFLWSYTSVKNVLTDESYTGVLRNRKRETRNGKTREIPLEQQYRHEGFYPSIVSSDIWRQAQTLLNDRSPMRNSYGNKLEHRYSGLMECKQCGNILMPMIRYRKGGHRVEYVCKGYHRYGKNVCSPHRIHEETIDCLFREKLEERRDAAEEKLKKVKELQKLRALREPVLNARNSLLRTEISRLESEIDRILLERMQFRTQCFHD